MKLQTLYKIEKITVVVMLLFYIGALSIQPPVGSPGFVMNYKSISEKLLAVTSYLIVPLLIAGRWKTWVYLLTKNITLVLFLILVAFSILWADLDLNQNLNQVRGLLLSSFFGFYLAARYSLKEQNRMLAIALGIAAVLSFLVGILLPSYGIHSSGGDLKGLAGLWNGVFDHKNDLGAHMAWSTGIFFSLSQSIKKGRLRLLMWAMFGLSFLLVILSGSAGALANSLIITVIVPLSGFIKKRYYKLQAVLMVSFIVISTTVSTLIAANAENLASAAGKDLSLTGRAPLWSSLMAYAAQKPWFGYGFNGFWPSERYGGVFKSRWTWKDVPHSHNGFIELLLALGIIGCLLFTISFLHALILASHKTYVGEVAEDIIPLQFLLTFAMANLSEHKLLLANNIYFVIFIATAVSLGLERKRMTRNSQLNPQSQ